MEQMPSNFFFISGLGQHQQRIVDQKSLICSSRPRLTLVAFAAMLALLSMVENDNFSFITNSDLYITFSSLSVNQRGIPKKKQGDQNCLLLTYNHSAFCPCTKSQHCSLPMHFSFASLTVIACPLDPAIYLL